MAHLIEIDNLKYSYLLKSGERRQALNGITLSIEKGSFTVILGHNGSGKSTLAKHLNALLLPEAGRVLVDHLDTSDWQNLLKIRSQVGMVFQNPDNQLVAGMVEEDVAFGPENLGIPPEEIRFRVDEALAAVSMTDYRKHAPHLLSGGQKQRVAIAGVIAMLPACIVLDESTAMLDPVGRQEIIRTIRKLNREYGITIILITHHMEEALEADRILVLADGGVFLDGKPEEVFREVEKLQPVGLTVPETVLLLDELRKSGIDVPPDVLSAEDCMQVLRAVLDQYGGKRR